MGIIKDAVVAVIELSRVLDGSDGAGSTPTPEGIAAADIAFKEIVGGAVEFIPLPFSEKFMFLTIDGDRAKMDAFLDVAVPALRAYAKATG